MNNKTKTPAESYTEQVHLVGSADLNGSGRLFGGALLSWIDVVAGITARRHANRNAITASIDNLDFIRPAYPNDVIVLTGRITYTGNTSLEVCVKSYIEDIDGSRDLMNEAYIVMVAIGDDGCPCRVPALQPQTEEEAADFEKGRERAERRKAHRAEVLASKDRS